jgi:hypothetical protein
MDWMQILMSLIPALSQGGGAAGGAAGGGGQPNLSQILPQILNMISSMGAGSYGQEQLGNMSNLFNQQQKAAQLALNPAALAKRTLAYTQPINKQLAYSVTQAADAATAGRGMAQAPGAVASGEAAALAPYAQQNLQMGQQAAEFGFPYQFAGQSPDYLSILKQLNEYGQGSTYSLPQGMNP